MMKKVKEQIIQQQQVHIDNAGRRNTHFTKRDQVVAYLFHRNCKPWKERSNHSTVPKPKSAFSQSQ